jgi:hypothetical protein
MVLLCYECTLELNKGCRLSWRLCLKQVPCLGHSDLICLESVVLMMEIVCYVSDWTSVTGKSWSGFGQYMCKDGAMGSWTMRESWQMGHSTDDTSWYAIHNGHRCSITNQPCRTTLHREQMKDSLRGLCLCRYMSITQHVNNVHDVMYICLAITHHTVVGRTLDNPQEDDGAFP